MIFFFFLSQDNIDQTSSAWGFNTQVFKGLAFYYVAHWRSPAQEVIRARTSIKEGLDKYSQGSVYDGLK